MGKISVLVRALMLVGMRRDPVDGGLYYMFGDENSVSDVTVAGQLVMRRLLVPDTRFIEQPPKTPMVSHACRWVSRGGGR